MIQEMERLVHKLTVLKQILKNELIPMFIFNTPEALKYQFDNKNNINFHFN